MWAYNGENTDSLANNESEEIQMKPLIFVTALVLVGCSNAAKNSQVATPQTSSTSNSITKKVEAPVASATPNSSAHSKVACDKGKDMRLLEVVQKKAGCVLDYTKFGKESDVTSDSKGSTKCIAAMNRIEDKLKGAGYKCL